MNIVKKYKKYVLILLFIFIIILLVILKIKLSYSKDTVLQEEQPELYEVVPSTDEEETLQIVSVDIKGAVVNPGVYEIEENKKVIDVINLAGGLNDDADTSLINLAKKVSDEMVVIIYTEDQIKKASEQGNSLINPIDNVCTCPEITNDACLTQKTDNQDNSSSNDKNTDESNTNGQTNSKVNINTASIEELQTLSGIGESKAKAIVEYRESNGNFSSIEDIKNVSGIGDSVYEKIKDSITV